MSIIVPENATYGLPSPGYVRIYVDGNSMYLVDSSGVVTSFPSLAEFGTAAFEDVEYFDLAGSSAAVQSLLETHENLTVGAHGFENATHAVYVSKTGDDLNSGLALNAPKLTIGAGLTVASSLLTAGATGVRVHVVDGGTYTEDLTVPTAVVLDAKAATLVGTVSVTGGSEVFLDRHYATANNQTMATMSVDVSGPALYVANISDGRGMAGTLTGVRNVRNNGGGGRNFFIRVGIMFVGEDGIGIGDTTSGFGHIHLLIPDLYLAGDNAVGIEGSANGANGANIVGFIDHILEIGSPLNTIGINMIAASASIRLVVAEIIADTAYSITAGSLYLVCPRIVGTVVGTPVFSAANASDLATHEGLTGTAVHGLGTASTLTAGATGAQLVTAATVDTARGVLDIPPQFNRPRHFDWQSGTWQSVDTLGSGSGNIAANIYHNLATGTTANSRVRRNINVQTFMLNRTNLAINWSKRLDISLQIRRDTSNAQGVFRVIVGKTTAAAFGTPTAGNYIGIKLENSIMTEGFVCKAGVLSTVTFASLPNANSNRAIFISSLNGTVSWYYNEILLGATTAGPIAEDNGTINLEIENGATAADYSMRLVGESWGY